MAVMVKQHQVLPDRHCHLWLPVGRKAGTLACGRRSRRSGTPYLFLTMEGYGPYQISKLLSEAKVEIPAVHLARFHEGVNRSKPVKDPYGWGSSTIVNILKKCEYLGHTVNFKTRKHFKDKKSHYVDESEWTIFENTHEAIID